MQRSKSPQLASFPSFKIVGDNIDKSIRPREETLEKHTESLHYFHSYAVKDRTDVSGLDDNAHLTVLEGTDVLEVLPSSGDRETLTQNMTIIAGGLLVMFIIDLSNLKFRKDNKEVLPFFQKKCETCYSTHSSSIF